eukprot:6310-Heterococcus_DN1.PRE.2
MPEGPASTKKNVEDLANEVDLKGKRVFVRVDLNAPLSKNAPYEVTDDTRLRAAVPTIKKSLHNTLCARAAAAIPAAGTTAGHPC